MAGFEQGRRLVAGLLVAVALGACGGGKEEARTASSAPTTEEPLA
jgi:hypothetical protein